MLQPEKLIFAHHNKRERLRVMATPSEKMAQALEVLKKLQEDPRIYHFLTLNN